MRSDRILLLISALFLISVLASGQEKPKFRQSENYGLHGPIHTQLNITKKLNEYPQDHKLHLRFQEGWVEFDPNGEVIERAHVDASGNLMTTVREKHDSQGRITESVTLDKDKTIRSHNEFNRRPDGETETTAFLDDKIFFRHLNKSDAQTGMSESTVFDKDGVVTSYSITHRSPLRVETQVWGKDGKFQLHTLRRYDDDHNLIESVRYDSQGKVVSDMSFKDEVLSSWWQAANCDCTNGVGFNRGNGSTVSYETTRDGKLLKNVQHHKGRRTNHEIDDEELYDENDHLLEKITYSYERDQHGNWTKRVASFLDVKTGDLVPVQEDTRTLTYY